MNRFLNSIIVLGLVGLALIFLVNLVEFGKSSETELLLEDPFVGVQKNIQTYYMLIGLGTDASLDFKKQGELKFDEALKTFDNQELNALQKDNALDIVSVPEYEGVCFSGTYCKKYFFSPRKKEAQQFLQQNNTILNRINEYVSAPQFQLDLNLAVHTSKVAPWALLLKAYNLKISEANWYVPAGESGKAIRGLEELKVHLISLLKSDSVALLQSTVILYLLESIKNFVVEASKEYPLFKSKARMSNALYKKIDIDPSLAIDSMLRYEIFSFNHFLSYSKEPQILSTHLKTSFDQKNIVKKYLYRLFFNKSKTINDLTKVYSNMRDSKCFTREGGCAGVMSARVSSLDSLVNPIGNKIVQISVISTNNVVSQLYQSIIVVIDPPIL